MAKARSKHGGLFVTQYTSLDTPLVHEVYEKDDNFIVTEGEGKEEVWIFFSGNGLYFPNDESTFRKVVIEQNRYEWTFVARCVRKRAKKIIFVRDVYKRWYLDGINASCDTPDKVAELLKREAAGAPVVTVGNSAGAYMALLIGTILEAKYVYAFNPQVCLSFVDKDDHPLVHSYEGTEKGSYFDLSDKINESPSTIFFFYAAENEDDKRHASLVEESSVCFFPFREKNHGKTVLAVNYEPLFSSPESLKSVRIEHPVSARKFLFLTAKGKGLYLYCKSIWTRGWRKLTKK